MFVFTTCGETIDLSMSDILKLALKMALERGPKPCPCSPQETEVVIQVPLEVVYRRTEDGIEIEDYGPAGG